MSFVPIGNDDVEREFVALHYGGGSLSPLPWGDAHFDATLIAECEFPSVVLARLARELVQLNVDWVATAGRAAEALHDAIDDASVLVGRQHAAGDGSPMTEWHDDALDPPAYASVATSLLGGNDHVLLVFVGEPSVFEALVFEVRRRLTGRSI